ncbi:MAG: hypothetical protein FJ218_02930 [Ignavibacteria bacterium]|nr:hypothetical protein [Ignavibacteria bacterium]
MFLKNRIDSFLSKTERNEIANFIHSLEEKTSGEIRVAVTFKRGFFEKKKSLQELALKAFFRLKMNNTRDKTGVLLFILVGEKQFHIVADEGINKKVEDGTWQKIATELSDFFKNQKYKDGIICVLDHIGKILSLNFPKKSDDANELTNEISFQ